MSKTFTVQCEHCKADTRFDIYGCPDLEDHIDRKIREAEDEAREEVESEVEDHADASVLIGGDRNLWELSAAIRRGDRASAEHHLDRIAAELGVRATEEVEQGRYSLLARAA